MEAMGWESGGLGRSVFVWKQDRRRPVRLCGVSQILVPALSRKRTGAASRSRLRFVFAPVMLVKLSEMLGRMLRKR